MQIGSSELAVEMLDDTDAVALIASLAENSPCLSLRGACGLRYERSVRSDDACLRTHAYAFDAQARASTCLGSSRAPNKAASFSMPLGAPAPRLAAAI